VQVTYDSILTGVDRRTRRIVHWLRQLAMPWRPRGADKPRARFWRLAQDFTPYVVSERDGHFHVLATDDPTHGNFFARKRSKELSVLRRALECLGAAGVEISRTTFVDIGANTGTTTLAALKAGFSSVLACEPAPNSFRLLRTNLVLNGVDESVRPLQVALSNRAGTGMLDLGSRSRKARVLAHPGESPRWRSQQIRLTRLDDLVAEGALDPAEVGMVFMDVEGHECHVLEGASTVLKEDVPLVMELNPKLLRLAGKIDDLADQLERHYTHILNLRDGSDPTFMPVDQLGALIDDVEESATDILACRLPSD
jgi:FkbM family methyltransferase